MQVIFFNKKTERFLESIKEPLRARADHSLHLLKEYANNLKLPYSKPLGGGLFELRIVGTIHIRFIYTFHDNQVWILDGFIKKTNKIPKERVDYARKQQRLLLQ